MRDNEGILVSEEAFAIFEADLQASEVLVLAIANADLRGRIEQQQLRWPGHLSRSQ
jgi:hypothetical protein